MSRNGSGVQTSPGSSFPAVASTLIESTKFNNVINDINTVLTQSISNDGQTPILANLPMGGFKLTGLAAGAGAGDSVEYAQALALLVTALSTNYLHIRDEKTSNTAGGTAVIAGLQTRVLNTVKINTITGASLAANVISLPAGTYRVSAKSPSYMTDRTRIVLYNQTDSANILVGLNSYSGNASLIADTSEVLSILNGQFTIAATKSIRIDQYTKTNFSGLDKALGVQINDGNVEVYSEIELWKLA